MKKKRKHKNLCLAVTVIKKLAPATDLNQLVLGKENLDIKRIFF